MYPCTLDIAGGVPLIAVGVPSIGTGDTNVQGMYYDVG